MRRNWSGNVSRALRPRASLDQPKPTGHIVGQTMSDRFKPAPSAELHWAVFVAPAKPVVTDDVPPGFPRRMFSPISATLISGGREAVLVDPLMTVEETRALSDWIAATGKNVTTIYITHGHGDHSFSVSSLREPFPRARAVAAPRVLQPMAQQAQR